MPALTRQQLADQLNTLSAQGASEGQLVNAIAKAGYTDSDFNLDLNGKFTPLTIGAGKVAGVDYAKPTAAEQADSDNFYKNLAAESSSTKPSSTTSTSTFSQSTGGGTTTVTGGAPTISPDAANAAKLANLKASAFTANPNGKFGNSTIDKALSSGAITTEEAAALKSGSISESDRFATASAARQNASATVAAGTVESAPTIAVTSNPNSATYNVVTQQAVGKPTTITSESNPNSNSTVVTNPDGTKSEITVNNADATITTTPLANNPLVQSTETTITASENTQPQANEQIAVSLPGGTMVFANQAALDAYRAGGAGSLIQQQLPGGTVYKVAPVETVENPAPQTTVDEFGQVVSVENAAPADTTTYYENNGTTGNEIVYPQLTPEELALAAQGDAGAGPGEISYEAPPVDDTVYYENNGTSSTSTPFPQLTPEELALAAQGDAGAGPGEFSYPPSGSKNSFNGLLKDTQSKATQGDATGVQNDRDWRVKLSLAKGGKYLYNVDGDAGILKPLQATDGVIFPYTPQISVNYAANYDATELTHSNYKIFQYKGSSVDQISITCDFTAQDTFEAEYLLAVIHFFRSVTKMFYGKDQKPNIGSPPPLCYLSGMGAFQFNNHPLAITSFNYSLPNDVDYIRTTSITNPGVNKSNQRVPDNSESVQKARIDGANLNEKQPVFQQPPPGSVEPTYVPTKMSIQISAIPIVSRNDISNRFSLTDYANGKLLRGNQNSTKGIW